jgi:CBS domain-containing protein
MCDDGGHHHGGEPATLHLRDIMTESVVTVTPETSLRALVELLDREGVSGVPVVVAGRVVGVVSATDVLGFEADTPAVPSEQPDQAEWGTAEESEEPWEQEEAGSPAFFADMWPDVGAELVERFEEVGSPEWDLLEEHAVSEAMTPTLCALPPEFPVPDAAAYMLDRAIHRVLVMEGGRLLGIVSTTDVVRAVAQGRIPVA